MAPFAPMPKLSDCVTFYIQFYAFCEAESTGKGGAQPFRKTQASRVRRSGVESSRGGVRLLRAVKRRRTPMGGVTPRKSAGLSKSSGAMQPSARPKNQVLSGGLREPRSEEHKAELQSLRHLVCR